MAGSEVLFISPDYIKRYTNINGSVLDEYFKPILLTTQETFIESYLGTDLYERLKSDIVGGSLAGDYLILHEKYVMKATLWRFMASFYEDVNVKIDNGGLGHRVSDDVESASVTALNRVRDRASRFADSYSVKLKEYLYHNSNLFPEYTTNTGEDVKPQGVNFLSISNGAQKGSYL